MTLMREPGFCRDLTDRQFALAEHLFCALDPPPNQVLMRREARRLAEEYLEMRV